jgi:hypothetical protein
MEDAPGAIHPAITSGINRQRIFKDSTEVSGAVSNWLTETVIGYRILSNL